MYIVSSSVEKFFTFIFSNLTSYRIPVLFVHKKHYSSNITDQNNFFLRFISLFHIRKFHNFLSCQFNQLSFHYAFHSCSKGSRDARVQRMQGVQTFIFIFSARYTFINLLAEKLLCSMRTE